METPFTQFGHSTSPFAVAFTVRHVNKHDEPSEYGIFCYADHSLYKVIFVSDRILDAQLIADVLYNMQANMDIEEFSTWVEQEFPEDVYSMTPEQIDRYFA